MTNRIAQGSLRAAACVALVNVSGAFILTSPGAGAKPRGSKIINGFNDEAERGGIRDSLILTWLAPGRSLNRRTPTAYRHYAERISPHFVPKPRTG